MKSFHTLDSDHKISRGGRGVGRLLWLKAFKNVIVESTFKDQEAQLKIRRFRFDVNAGVADEQIENVTSGSTTGTVIQLNDFEPRACYEL